MLAPRCQRCKLWIAQLRRPRLDQFDKSMPEAIFQQAKGYQAAIRRFEKIITREQVARRVGIFVQAVAQSGTKQGRFKQAQIKPDGLPRVVALAQGGKYGGTSKTAGYDIGDRYAGTNRK